jgi:hypothetical protein
MGQRRSVDARSVFPRTAKDQADDGLASAVAALADQVQRDGVTGCGQDAVRLLPRGELRRPTCSAASTVSQARVAPLKRASGLPRLPRARASVPPHEGTSPPPTTPLSMSTKKM